MCNCLDDPEKLVSNPVQLATLDDFFEDLYAGAKNIVSDITGGASESIKKTADSTAVIAYQVEKGMPYIKMVGIGLGAYILTGIINNIIQIRKDM